MTVYLSQLLSALPQELILEIPLEMNIPIFGIVLDSRQVKPGCMFVALTGSNVDGHRYILSAIQNGATAVVG
ncbi:MAG: Mur ligase domain-containing protein, partial [Anaerolineaceae bacterium]